MAGRGARIGIVVITVREVRAAIQKHAETAVTKLIVIALQVVPAKLVNHDHDHQLGMTVIGGSKACDAAADGDRSNDQCEQEAKSD